MARSCIYIYHIYLIYIPHIYPLNRHLNGDDNPEGMALGLYTTLQNDSQDVYLGCLVCFLSFAASHTRRPGKLTVCYGKSTIFKFRNINIKNGPWLQVRKL